MCKIKIIWLFIKGIERLDSRSLGFLSSLSACVYVFACASVSSLCFEIGSLYIVQAVHFELNVLLSQYLEC